MAVTVFVVLSLDPFYGYIVLALNTLICLFFALAIHFEFVTTILLAEYQLDTWIGVSSNLIFFKCADGTYKYILDRAFVIRDDEGTPARMIGAMQDITDQKEYEEELEQLSLVAAKKTDALL